VYSVTGPDKILTWMKNTYDISCNNANNVDADIVILTIAMPAVCKFSVETEDFFGRPVPSQIYDILSTKFSGYQVDGIAVLFAYAKNVPVGKTLRASLKVSDLNVPGHSEFPVFVGVSAQSAEEFLLSESALISQYRDFLLKLPADSLPPVLLQSLLKDSSCNFYLKSFYDMGFLGDNSLNVPTLSLNFNPSIFLSAKGFQGRIPTSVNYFGISCSRFVQAATLAIIGTAACIIAVETAPIVIPSSVATASDIYNAILFQVIMADEFGITIGGTTITFAAGELEGLFGAIVKAIVARVLCIETDYSLNSNQHLHIGTWDCIRQVLLQMVVVTAQGFDLLRQFGNTVCGEVWTPYDPNYLIGPYGSGDYSWINKVQTLGYNIFFENDSTKGNAAAHYVTIIQQTDTTINPNSFRLGEFGFGSFTFKPPENCSYYQKRLDVRDSLGVFVDVTAGLDVTTNKIVWNFRSIDPATGEPPTDPLKGFLPVNDSLNHGQGFVSYTVEPKSTTKTGDIVYAKASIVFDYNDPVETNEWFNTIDAVAPVSHVNSNISIIDTASLRISWSGYDDSTGSGIRDYSLYVAVDTGAFSLFSSGLTDTSTTYPALVGHTYKFFTLARDNAGNIEQMKSNAEASIFFQGPAFKASVQAGWNMISVPRYSNNLRASTLFPTAISNAFGYSGTYFITDSLKIGSGYWLKFSSQQSIEIVGTEVLAETIGVNIGWNIIGGISKPVPIVGIESDPPAIVTSSFFGYNPGNVKYEKTDTIFPGIGYWVKVNQVGKLILAVGSQNLSKAIIIKPDSDLPPPPPSDTSTSVLEYLPKQFSLEQAFPNPFNPITHIKYALPVESKVRILIYNILGQRVLTLVDEVQSAGYKSVEWNASNFASGIYLYRIEAVSVVDKNRSFTQVKKMILLR